MRYKFEAVDAGTIGGTQWAYFGWFQSEAAVEIDRSAI